MGVQPFFEFTTRCSLRSWCLATSLVASARGKTPLFTSSYDLLRCRLVPPHHFLERIDGRVHVSPKINICCSIAVFLNVHLGSNSLTTSLHRRSPSPYSTSSLRKDEARFLEHHVEDAVPLALHQVDRLDRSTPLGPRHAAAACTDVARLLLFLKTSRGGRSSLSNSGPTTCGITRSCCLRRSFQHSLNDVGVWLQRRHPVAAACQSALVLSQNREPCTFLSVHTCQVCAIEHNAEARGSQHQMDFLPRISPEANRALETERENLVSEDTNGSPLPS